MPCAGEEVERAAAVGAVGAGLQQGEVSGSVAGLQEMYTMRFAPQAGKAAITSGISLLEEYAPL